MKRSFFRRVFSLAAAALLLLSLPVSAGAEGSLRGFYEAGRKLLFDTDNVTCEGNAVFRLDGTKFKTADFRYVQVGTVSFQDLKLLTPRKDGTERESGYMIFDENGIVSVMERFYPNTYDRRRTNPASTIMATSIYLNQLLDLGGNVTDEVEKALGDKIVTAAEASGGTTMKLSLTEADVPALGHSALNLFWDYFMKRFYFLDYDTFPDLGYASFSDYGTLFDGIRFITASVKLQKADLTFTLDASGRIKGLSGTAALQLTTRAGENAVLDVDFSFAASDYGTSTIKAFRPEDYNVVRRNPYD